MTSKFMADSERGETDQDPGEDPSKMGYLENFPSNLYH